MRGFQKASGGRRFWGVFLVFGVALGSACERAPKAPEPAMVNRALVWGEMRGREVAFFAQEMTMMHPESERSRAARRALIELDDVLRGEDGMEGFWEGGVERGAEEIE